MARRLFTLLSALVLCLAVRTRYVLVGVGVAAAEGKGCVRRYLCGQ